MIKAYVALNLKTELHDRAAIGAMFPRANVTQCAGVYSGVAERSYCFAIRPDELARLLKLAANYQQESVLIIFGHDCWLFYTDGTTEQLPGTYSEITATRAQQLPAYTQETGRFYAVV